MAPSPARTLTRLAPCPTESVARPSRPVLLTWTLLCSLGQSRHLRTAGGLSMVSNVLPDK
jgi:hypothetical protein